jgi:hypothetical protein
MLRLSQQIDQLMQQRFDNITMPISDSFAAIFLRIDDLWLDINCSTNCNAENLSYFLWENFFRVVIDCSLFVLLSRAGRLAPFCKLKVK